MSDAPQARPNEPSLDGTRADGKADDEQFEHLISLPNGLDFFLSSRQMVGAAEFLRKEIFHRARYRRDGFEVTVRKPLLDYYSMKFGEIWARRA